MMLGFLLARVGVDVLVLEKHADFLRDFRGDTVHPSTLDVIYELGLLDDFLKRTHQEVRELSGQIGSETVPIADFTHLPTHCKFIALMPQWDFLNFLAEKARAFPSFRLMTESDVTELIEEHHSVVGVIAQTPKGPLEIRAGLIVGADGRHSVVRDRAKLEVIDLGAPMDVLWMRISRKPNDPGQTFGHVEPGRILVLLNREDYWQCAYVIPKGKAEEVEQKGIEQFREEILRLQPFLGDRVQELRSWDDVKLLTVSVDRLYRWCRPGLLCIGDAAHAMSPIGGIGINLAVQDAVAAANILGPKFQHGNPDEYDLIAVERRRMFPTRATQGLQIAIQNNIIGSVLGRDKPLTIPWPVKLLQKFPVLRRIPARVVGVGFRPEHVKSV